MNDDIFFSVMICCYNSERYLSETLDSVVSQTYKNWEIVAINDGSSDDTEKILMNYKNDGIPITYHKQTNQGFASARNKAIELAKGDWIAIIDHDDICLPNRLEVQIEHIKNNFSGVDIYLDTSQKTYKFFEKFGFVVKKITTNGYGVGLDRYDMILKVKPKK